MADPGKSSEPKQPAEPAKLAPLNSDLLRGVQVALAATNASDVVPPGMRLSSLSAWFLRPGVSDLVAQSMVVHAGRHTVLVRSDVTGSDGANVLHAITQFVRVAPLPAR